MLWHIVKARFGPDVGEEERAAWERSVVALAGQIPEIAFLRLARSINEPDVTGLVSGFVDVAALDVYRHHPAHVPVVARMRELCPEVTRLDIVTDDPPTALPRTP